MATCTCTTPTGITIKPSGLAVCNYCGGVMPIQPPKKPARP